MSIKRCPADTAFSDAVRLSRNSTCEHCHRIGRCEAAHIYGRRHKSIRWDTMNILCLCHTCHRTFTENPLDFDVWVKKYLGQGHVDLLNEKRNRIWKDSKKARQPIAKHYREEFRRMESTGDRNLVSYQ